MSKFGRTPPNQGDYTGRAQAGGRPRATEGHGGFDSPSARGGSRYGASADGLHDRMYLMEDPQMVRARGRAPKNYRRSDERIREDICERLSEDQNIDPADVSVEVKNGIVMLEGTVPVRHMRYRIEDIAAECLGSDDIENRIRLPKTVGNDSR